MRGFASPAIGQFVSQVCVPGAFGMGDAWSRGPCIQFRLLEDRRENRPHSAVCGVRKSSGIKCLRPLLFAVDVVFGGHPNAVTP